MDFGLMCCSDTEQGKSKLYFSQADIQLEILYKERITVLAPIFIKSRSRHIYVSINM